MIIIFVLILIMSLTSGKEYKTPFANFILANGILIGKYKTGLVITIDIAKQIAKDRIKISGEKSYPLLIDGSGLKSIDREAREYFASEEGQKYITAAAFLAGSRFTAIIGNFFLKVTLAKLNFPVRLFYDERKAKLWLGQYREKNV